MTRIDGGSARAAIAIAALLLASAPARTEGGPAPTALSRVETGLWQLRDLDDESVEHQSICVAEPEMLMQVQHRDPACSREVVANGPKSATMHYSCPAAGFGSTSLRLETPRLVKLDTQGIADKVPFAHRLEARRTGDCPALQSAGRR